MNRATVLLLGLAAWCIVAAAAWAADNAPCFVKKDTWLETVLASREALASREGQAEKQAQAGRAADAAAKQSFAAVRFEMTGRDQPRDVRLQVAGLKRIYIGVAGERGLYFGHPRVVNRDGNAQPVELGQPKGLICASSGSWGGAREGENKPISLAGQEFAHWLRGQDGELTVELGDQADWLLMTVGLRTKDERKAQAWVDCRPSLEMVKRPSESRQEIWRLAAEAFPGKQTLRQQRLEEVAGIWDAEWKDLAELAGRYANACEGPLRQPAQARARECKSIAELQAVRDMFYARFARPRLELARKTLDFVERAAPRPELAARLAELERQYAAGKGGEGLYAQACELRRLIILSHPLLDFPKLLINKRTGFLPEHMCDQYLGRHSQVAPGLVVLENWKDSPQETVLLEGKLPKGGLIQPDLSFDGKRILFAFANHAGQRNSQLRGYYIYEYSFETGNVRQITGTERDPLEGRNGRETVLIEDFEPCYLPDGGFAFISTRSQQYGRCHGGRYVPAYTLYRAELDGSGVQALSYNESNEWAPSVLPDGSIVYCRWDYVNRHDTIFQSLWTIHPDGTQTAHYYGNNSRSPCMISQPQPIPNTHKTVCTAAAHHGQTLGTIIVVDPYKGQEGGQPLTWITPELGFPESGIPEGITKAASPLPEDVQGGRAATPWPLSEDLFLCTYQNGSQSNSQFAIYLVDTLGGRELICADPATSCFNPIPLRPRPKPPVVTPAVVSKPEAKTGVFFVQDVYQSTQPLQRGTIKELRINEIISQPTSSVPPRSHAENELVKKVLGTVPVAADGAAAFEAPAATPLQFQLLDANGMAVMTMRSLVYLQPGEKASCVGCHESRSSAPPPAALARPTVHKIAPPVGPQYEGGLSFMRTVQPVLDRYCICCHGLEKPRGPLDLTGGFTKGDEVGQSGKREMPAFSVAYESLIRAPGFVSVAPRNGETVFSKPKDYFAHAGKLAKLLLDGHPGKDGKKRLELDRESFQRVVYWLDLNAQFYGDYSFNRAENQPPLANGEKTLRAAIEKRFGSELAGQPYAALVNVANAAESRILLAPLPAAAGGWGQISTGAYGGTDDPSYQEMRALVGASITPLKYHDVAGTCGREASCCCGNCWVRKDVEARRQHAGQKEEKLVTGQSAPQP
ncbi:MAG: hypothetical protein NTW87_02435 [Planctomycetota bacterium]|nr:hypothetical protein [Planctomycetota bacterium]